MAQHPLDEEILRALREETVQVVEERQAQWQDLQALVWARVDETHEDELGVSPGWPVLAEALGADHAAAAAALEARGGAFADGVSLRCVEATEPRAASLGAFMRREVTTAVSAKDGAWSAFTHQVMAEIDRVEGLAGESTTDGVIRAVQADVEAELQAMAPRFDRDFREGVERRIFRSARPSPSWWRSVGASVTSWLRPSPGMGLAAATAAAAVVALLVPRPEPAGPPSGAKVSISAVRFGASTVTVVPDHSDDGIAVVWVTDGAS